MAASFFVNPLTTLGIWDIAKKTPNCRSVVLNAGASSLAKMFLRFSMVRQFPVISIVRREEQVRQLTEMGAKFIINTSDDDWQRKLKTMAAKLDARVFADAIGGRDAGIALQLLPSGTTMLNYGALSGKSISGVAEADLIFYEKTITGFWLGTWMNTLKPL